jgi:hypothetical protein
MGSIGYFDLCSSLSSTRPLTKKAKHCGIANYFILYGCNWLEIDKIGLGNKLILKICHRVNDEFFTSVVDIGEEPN